MQHSWFNVFMRSSLWKPLVRGIIMVLALYVLLSFSTDSRGNFSPEEIVLENERSGSKVSVEKVTGRKGTVYKLFNGTADDDPEFVEYIKNRKILPPSQESYNLKQPKLVDGSQFGQTKLVDRMLGQMTGGFFVEVGAHDGESLSNTLFFERFRNWTGLLIEAGPKLFDTLVTKNRKAYAIHACLSLTPESSIVNFVTSGYNGRITKNKDAGVSIQCVPLYTLMLALDRSQIDFFSLDIEGDELKVLKTIPWDKMQIRLMVVEVNHIEEGKEAVIKYMESVGYTFLKAHSIDLIFGKPELLEKTGVEPGAAL